MAEFDRGVEVFETAGAFVQPGRAPRVVAHPGRKLAMHQAQLAGRAQRLQGQQEAPPELVAPGGRQLVVETGAGAFGLPAEIAQQVGGQGAQGCLVPREEPEGLDVEDKTAGRALRPGMRGLGGGQAVIGRIRLDHRKAGGVEAQAGGRIAGLGRVETPAGQQGGVGPGGSADQEAHTGGKGRAPGARSERGIFCINIQCIAMTKPTAEAAIRWTNSTLSNARPPPMAWRPARRPRPPCW